VVIALKDLVRAVHSGVWLWFCFFLEKVIMDDCVFCGEPKVRFLATPEASFIILLLNELIVRVYSPVLVFLVLDFDFDFELLEFLALPSLADRPTGDQFYSKNRTDF